MLTAGAVAAAAAVAAVGQLAQRGLQPRRRAPWRVLRGRVTFFAAAIAARGRAGFAASEVERRRKQREGALPA